MSAAAEIAFRELLAGVHEVAGREHNARILEYHRATRLRASDDETSWCAAFVNWSLLQAGVEGTNAANARSFMDWGVAAEAPKPGDIVVLWRGKRDGWQGHVGFYLGRSNGRVYILGGNQGDAVSVDAFHEDRVLGYRRSA
jgi:uncharacterized protein (TIGR02594 family)